MKCKFCGAEVKEGSSICEYCGSEVEKSGSEVKEIIREEKNPLKGIIRIVARTILAMAVIWAVVGIVSTIIVLNSDAFKNTYRHSPAAAAVHEMPKEEKGLSGQIITYDENGIVSLDYQGHIYENIKIQDKELISWLNDTGRTLDNIEIRFATDKKGDISELGLLSADFFVFGKEGKRYIAVRDTQVFSFTSAEALETEHYYGGYFSYPDVRLYWGEEKSPFALSYMDPKCDGKESTTEQDSYTGEGITVYKILIEGTWYYCGKETYDTIQVGDIIKEYEMCTVQELSFLVMK